MRKDYIYPFRVINPKMEKKLNKQLITNSGFLFGLIIAIPLLLLEKLINFILPKKIINILSTISRNILSVITLLCIILIIYVFYSLITLGNVPLIENYLV